MPLLFSADFEETEHLLPQQQQQLLPYLLQALVLEDSVQLFRHHYSLGEFSADFTVTAEHTEVRFVDVVQVVVKIFCIRKSPKREH